MAVKWLTIDPAWLTKAVLVRAAYVALGAVLALSVSKGIVPEPDVRVVERLVKAGFHTPTEPLKKGDLDFKLPRGVKPVAVVSGGVRYLPTHPVPPPPALDRAAPPPAGDQAGAGTLVTNGRDLCATQDVLSQVDATLRCRAEVVQHAGTPYARLFVAGRLQLGESVRDLPERIVEDVNFSAAPEPKRLKRFGWTVGAGAGYDPGSGTVVPVLGVMWGVRF